MPRTEQMHRTTVVALVLALSSTSLRAQQAPVTYGQLPRIERVVLKADNPARAARAELTSGDPGVSMTVSDSAGKTVVAASRMMVTAPVVLTFPEGAFRITIVSLDSNVHVELPEVQSVTGARFQSTLNGRTLVFSRASAGLRVQVEAQQIRNVRLQQNTQ